MMCIMTARYFLGAPPDFTMVSVFEKVDRRAHVVPCSKDYEPEKSKFHGMFNILTSIIVARSGKIYACAVKDYRIM